MKKILKYNKGNMTAAIRGFFGAISQLPTRIHQGIADLSSRVTTACQGAIGTLRSLTSTGTNLVSDLTGRVGQGIRGYISSQSPTTYTNEQALQRHLDQWASTAQPSENRAEAVHRMMECYRNGNENLNLSNLGLQSLPDKFDLMPQLTGLNLSANDLTTIPPTIQGLNNLVHLYLDQNPLLQIPASIADLPNLRDLKVDLTTDLPLEIQNKAVRLGTSVVDNVLNTWALAGPEPERVMRQLAASAIKNNIRNRSPFLDIDGYGLTSFPPCISQLHHLERINAAENKLTDLPENLSNLSNLNLLKLDNNCFATVPPVITRLSNLEHLNMNNNQLTSIPQELKDLQHLQSLRLRNNRLENFCSTLMALHHKVDIRNNSVKLSILSTLFSVLVSIANKFNINLEHLGWYTPPVAPANERVYIPTERLAPVPPPPADLIADPLNPPGAPEAAEADLQPAFAIGALVPDDVPLPWDVDHHDALRREPAADAPAQGAVPQPERVPEALANEDALPPEFDPEYAPLRNNPNVDVRIRELAYANLPGLPPPVRQELIRYFTILSNSSQHSDIFIRNIRLDSATNFVFEIRESRNNIESTLALIRARIQSLEDLQNNRPEVDFPQDPVRPLNYNWMRLNPRVRDIERPGYLAHIDPAQFRPMNEIRMQFNSRGEDRGVIEINPDHITTDPTAILLRMPTAISRNRGRLPEVRHVAQGQHLQGVDAGGLRRSLATGLFKEIFKDGQQKLPVIKRDDLFIPQIKPNEQLDPAQQNTCYRGLGAILGVALGDQDLQIRVGQQLHPVVFKMMHSLTQTEINQFSDSGEMPADLQQKMRRIYIETQYPHFSPEQVIGIANRTITENALGAPIEDFYAESGIDEAIQATMVMAKSMTMTLLARGLQFERLKGATPEAFQVKIQGSLSKQVVLRALAFDSDRAIALHLRRWIDAASDQQLGDLVECTTGIRTLPENGRLIVKGYSYDGNPRFHTCGRQMDLYSTADYATFKVNLEASVGACLQGDRLSMA